MRVLVFYLATMVFSGVLNAVQAATGPDPDLIQLVQFAPALGVGVMFLLFRRTTRVRARFTPAAVAAGRSALVVGIVIVALLASVFVHVIAGHSWRAESLPFPLGVLVITTIIGVLWGFWHVGGFAHGVVYMGLFVVMATALSVVMGAVLQSARGTNLAVATAAHAAVNLGLILSSPRRTATSSR